MRLIWVVPLSVVVALPVYAQQAIVNLKSLSPEAAITAAQAGAKACRDKGFAVAVAVVDRSGVPLAMVRDRFAGPHTPDTATRKAWTAVSFKTNTTELVERTQPNSASAGIRSLPNVAVIGGGVMIESAGSLVGGIGVSGAPSGKDDEDCAKAGIAAIKDQLEL